LGVEKVRRVEALEALAAGQRHDEINLQHLEQSETRQTGVE
jgi:hypothetical protein